MKILSDKSRNIVGVFMIAFLAATAVCLLMTLIQLFMNISFVNEGIEKSVMLTAEGLALYELYDLPRAKAYVWQYLAPWSALTIICAVVSVVMIWIIAADNRQLKRMGKAKKPLLSGRNVRNALSVCEAVCSILTILIYPVSEAQSNQSLYVVGASFYFHEECFKDEYAQDIEKFIEFRDIQAENVRQYAVIGEGISRVFLWVDIVAGIWLIVDVIKHKPQRPAETK